MGASERAVLARYAAREDREPLARPQSSRRADRSESQNATSCQVTHRIHQTSLPYVVRNRRAAGMTLEPGGGGISVTSDGLTTL